MGAAGEGVGVGPGGLVMKGRAERGKRKISYKVESQTS